MKILVINPGSTSTKIAVFKERILLFESTVHHSKDQLAAHETIPAQKDFRFQMIQAELEKSGYSLNSMDAIAARGGIIKPIESGTYEINASMVADLNNSKAALHASCLAGLIAYDLKKQYQIPAYIVDPVVVDELEPIARLTGTPEVSRQSVFHALNQKAAARQAAKELGKPYEALNLIVAHLGGGISVGAHKQGRVVDVNNAIAGSGPFSPERTGSLAPLQVAELIFDKGYEWQDIKNLTSKQGGLVAYLGTNDMRAVLQKIAAGDQEALLVFEAMAYQIAKEISSLAAAFCGKIDGIVLTGGLAYAEALTKIIAERIGFLGPLFIYAGEFELQALADSVWEVVSGKKQPKSYF